MLQSVIIFLFAFGIIIAETHFESRIVGGENATLGEIPYIVSIRGQNRHGCGGSILNEKFVLTAAHCVYEWDNRPDLFSVQYGVIEISQKEPNVLPVRKITVHENFDITGSIPNDIALLEINGQFKFGPNAQPVKLPTPFQDPEDNVNALLAGWGLDKTGGRIQKYLKKVIIQKFADSYCKSSVSQFDSDIHICAGIFGGGKGQCTADSGGPLTIDGIQYGIVSWSNKPCASPGNPGIYTKVTSYRNWIRLHTGV